MEFQKKRVKGSKSLFKEIIAENFPNLSRYMDIQTQKTKQGQPKDYSDYNQNVKIKDKERILKVSRRK